MASPTHPLLALDHLSQLGFVVHDVERATGEVSRSFEVGQWRSMDVSTDDDGTSVFYRGKPAQCSFRLARTRKLGGIEIELIQPLAGESAYSDFLRERGEGVHHVGWHVADTLVSFEQAVADLEVAGFPRVMHGRIGQLAFAYVDTSKALNTVLEVICRLPA